MADIFLSHNQKDRDAASRLANTLESVGWSVWWDRRIPAGQTWRNVLERELQTMRCMVVLWSANSVVSDWVCEEAAEGRQLGRLVPVLIDRVRPATGFREIQAADLVDWDGSRDHAGLKQLIADIERLIGTPSAARDAAPHAASLQGAPVPEALSNHATLRDLADGPQGRHPFSSAARTLPRWGLAALALIVTAAVYVGVSRRESPLAVESPVPAQAASPATAAPPLAVRPAAVDGAPPREPTQSPGTAVVVPSLPTGKGMRSAPTPSPASCVALLERLALGETLSVQSQSVFDRECRQ